MKYILFFSLAALLASSCHKHYEVVQPDTGWDQFESALANPLKGSAANRLEGRYSTGDGADRFGADAVLKWSYDAIGTDTTFYVSLFCAREVTWIILTGKRIDSTVLLNGSWRSMGGTQTGAARLTIEAAAGGRALLSGGSLQGLRLTGVYGVGTESPERALSFDWSANLSAPRPLAIVVHRGGGQTADLLPASENSAEIIPYAARFGATGIEIDVRLTSDGVPVLYHDATLSERLIVRNGMVGPVENYSYAQLHDLVRLVRNNERIPTLREALETVVTRTPLRFVWLDTKFDGDLGPIRALQQEFMQRAAALGKPLEIVIGVPDQTVLDRFRALPDYRNIPSVCELETSDASSINSRIWAPRWTLGLLNNEVDAVHAEGRRAFVWTLDLPENIELFLREGHFDGILSNYPSAVAYAYYTQP